MVVILLTAGAVSAAGLLEIDRLKQFIPQTLQLPAEAVDREPPGRPQTIMVLGTDGRLSDDPEADQRSDTILLARLDPGNRAITLMSIPRDLRVDIPGRGEAKINEAYSLGGAALTLKTVKALLSRPGKRFKVNHVVEVNFTGFRELVDYLGCVYVDVDRRYFNDVGGPLGYATIDIQEGYQRVCGSDALDYVRYRHLDSDLVRGARQQDFVRQMLRQPQVRSRLTFSRRTQLVKLAGRYSRMDRGLARSSKQLLSLLKLGLGVSAQPVQQIPFGGGDVSYSTGASGAAYVDVAPAAVAGTVERFLDPPAPPAPKKRIGRPRPTGLVDQRAAGEAVVRRAKRDIGMRLYFPSVGLPGSSYSEPEPRVYRLRGRPAYRLSIELTGGDRVGAYYGVQGMRWRDAPILDAPYKDVVVDRRTFSVYLDGSKTALVAWKTPNAVYYVHNTLTRDLTRTQMLAIARSLVILGSR